MRHSRTTHGIAFVLLFSVFPYIYNLIICTITMGSIRQSLIGSSTLKTDWRISAERDLRNYKGKNIYREQRACPNFFPGFLFCQNEDSHAYRARPDLSSAQKNFRFRAPVGWANRKISDENRQKSTKVHFLSSFSS